MPSCFILCGVKVIALCTSQVEYWTLSDLRDSSSSVMYFCLFILFMGFWQQEYWSGFLFPNSVDHILLERCKWPFHFGWSCMAWLIAPLSYARPISMTRLWSMKGQEGLRITFFLMHSIYSPQLDSSCNLSFLFIDIFFTCRIVLYISKRFTIILYIWKTVMIFLIIFIIHKMTNCFTVEYL